MGKPFRSSRMTSAGPHTPAPAVGFHSAAERGKAGLVVRRLFLPLALLGLGAWTGGCVTRIVVVPPPQQIAIDRRFVETPTDTQLTVQITGLTAPTAFCFDTDNTLLIAEGGIAGDEPRILAFRTGRPGYTVVYPTGRRIPFSPIHTGFQMYGPIGGIYADHGRIFVTHRDV